MGFPDQSGCSFLVGAGKRTPRITKKLGFDQCSGKRRAVDGDKLTFRIKYRHRCTGQASILTEEMLSGVYRVEGLRVTVANPKALVPRTGSLQIWPGLNCPAFF